MHLTLLIPELLWPEPGDTQTLGELPCPALATLLGRSRMQRTEGGAFDASIAGVFGLPADAPYAALRLLGEGIDPGAHLWTCADPVHLRFHQERLVLADGTAIGIETGEADALVGELNRYFSDLGEFRAAAPERWYLRLSADAQFSVPPLSAMAGRRIDRQLPEEGRTAWLRKLLNEAQMLLHSHPVNEARSDNGRMTINSLWLWGPGPLPATVEQRFDRVCSRQPLALGLARHTGARTQAAPGSLGELMTDAGNDERILVVLDDLLEAVQYEDGSAWRQGMGELERHWFAPLMGAIRSGRVRLTLVASTIYGQLSWEGAAADLWKLWRRPQAPAMLAEQLSKEQPPS